MRSARRWQRPSPWRSSNRDATRRPRPSLRSAPGWVRAATCLTQIRWRRVRARVLARRAEIQAAEALAREALAIAEATDFVNERADALIDLSHVLEESRRCDEAVAAASGAVHLYELKGNVVAAAAARLRLGELTRVRNN